MVQKQKEELEQAGVSEKNLWTELLRWSRTNFSEAYQILTHLKVIRIFTESVLRYGLPPDYFAVAIRPNTKKVKQLRAVLEKEYKDAAPPQQQGKNGKTGAEVKSSNNQHETPGEYAQLLEEEWTPYVLMDQILL